MRSETKNKIIRLIKHEIDNKTEEKLRLKLEGNEQFRVVLINVIKSEIAELETAIYEIINLAE